MSYTHLSAQERLELYKLKTSTTLSLRQIAQRLGRSQSTVSRELQRNQVEVGLYLPEVAQQKMQGRRQQAKQKFSSVSQQCLQQIKARLKQYHSPEQIVGRMQREGQAKVSHETLYQMIYQNHKGLGAYQKYLRQGHQKRKRRGSTKPKRGAIPGRVGIEERPTIADLKIEVGHWESDTMIGANHCGVIVTHVDKASKFLVAGLAKNKTSEAINQTTINLFNSLEGAKRKTMTFDNGKEFSGHKELADILGVACYFANPYHSWERGLNEHTNGLLRQFFPKGTNFKIIKPEKLENAINLINNRPRKSLDYRTPYEVFFSYTSGSDALQI